MVDLFAYMVTCVRACVRVCVRVTSLWRMTHGEAADLGVSLSFPPGFVTAAMKHSDITTYTVDDACEDYFGEGRYDLACLRRT